MFMGYGHNFRVVCTLTTTKNINKGHIKIYYYYLLLQNSATTYYQHQHMNYKIKGQIRDKTCLKWMRIKGQD